MKLNQKLVMVFAAGLVLVGISSQTAAAETVKVETSGFFGNKTTTTYSPSKEKFDADVKKQRKAGKCLVGCGSSKTVIKERGFKVDGGLSLGHGSGGLGLGLGSGGKITTTEEQIPSSSEAAK